MTTVIVDVKNKVMAADKQATDQGYKYRTQNKILRLEKDGKACLLSFAGTLSHCVKFVEWFENNWFKHPKKRTQFDFGKQTKFSAIVLYDTGRLVEFEGSTTEIVVKSMYHAIGSGRDYALGAVYSGASLTKAVRIASLLDPFTGFGVQVEKL